MKILVTGCAGFIGANFVNYELDTYPDDTVIGVDCLTYAANIEALESLKKREHFAFYKVDICDEEKIFEIFGAERPDAVINFAAESHVDRSIESSAPFVRTNVLGTQVLLDASVKYGVRRFHQVSTDEVYGDLPLDSEFSFDENAPLRPSSPYSASKAAADMLVLSYFRTHGLSVTVSRSSNNFGRYQHTEKLIPNVISRIKRGVPIRLYGDGKNVRDWLYVADHCRAVDLIARSSRGGEIYNVGAGNLLSNVKLVEKIIEISGVSEARVEFVADRLGHDLKYSQDSSKIERELGWRPLADFDSALRETVLAYKQF